MTNILQPLNNCQCVVTLAERAIVFCRFGGVHTQRTQYALI